MTNRMNNKCERETKRKFKAMPAELLTENNKKMRKRHLIEFFLIKKTIWRRSKIFLMDNQTGLKTYSALTTQPTPAYSFISVALLACE
jgi:hypothetical protein